MDPSSKGPASGGSTGGSTGAAAETRLDEVKTDTEQADLSGAVRASETHTSAGETKVNASGQILTERPRSGSSRTESDEVPSRNVGPAVEAQGSKVDPGTTFKNVEGRTVVLDPASRGPISKPGSAAVTNEQKRENHDVSRGSGASASRPADERAASLPHDQALEKPSNREEAASVYDGTQSRSDSTMRHGRTHSALKAESARFAENGAEANIGSTAQGPAGPRRSTSADPEPKSVYGKHQENRVQSPAHAFEHMGQQAVFQNPEHQSPEQHQARGQPSTPSVPATSNASGVQHAKESAGLHSKSAISSLPAKDSAPSDARDTLPKSGRGYVILPLKRKNGRPMSTRPRAELISAPQRLPHVHEAHPPPRIKDEALCVLSLRPEVATVQPQEKDCSGGSKPKCLSPQKSCAGEVFNLQGPRLGSPTEDVHASTSKAQTNAQTAKSLFRSSPASTNRWPMPSAAAHATGEKSIVAMGGAPVNASKTDSVTLITPGSSLPSIGGNGPQIAAQPARRISGAPPSRKSSKESRAASSNPPLAHPVTGMSPVAPLAGPTGTVKHAVGAGSGGVQFSGAAVPTGTTPGGGTQNYRQLKVEDALAYLEQVKHQFGGEPHVYNQFLDIMKEFKAQIIDTTQVIRRVSQLFRGHKMLILGFNTFLPPGYKIEVREDASTGVTTTGFSGPGGFASLSTAQPAAGPLPQPPVPPVPQQQQQQQQQQQHQLHQASVPQSQQPGRMYGAPSIHGNLPVARNVFKEELKLWSDVPRKRKRGYRPMRTIRMADISSDDESPTGAELPSGPGGSVVSQVENSPPGRCIEFNQAINYVNKIKNRFSSSVWVYRHFLEILHTYQKEQKTIEEVYEQVAKLFRDHPDLLDEFTHFLPDSTSIALQSAEHRARGYSRQIAAPTAKPAALQGISTGSKRKQPSSLVQRNQVASSTPVKPPTPTSSKRMKPAGVLDEFRESSPSLQKRFVDPSRTLTGSASAAGTPVVGGAKIPKPNKKESRKKEKLSISAAESGTQGLNTDASGMANARLQMDSISPSKRQELMFFEHIREKLGPQGPQIYSEFIKCLSLFSKEIISKQELVMLSEELFENHPGVYRAFTAYLDGVVSLKACADAARQVLLKEADGAQASLEARAPSRLGSSSAAINASGAIGPSGMEASEATAFGTTALSSPMASSSTLLNTTAADGMTVEQMEEALSNPKLVAKLHAMRSRPMSEIAAESAQKSTESYKKLPPDFPMPVCSGKLELERKTLNDVWVSVPTGSEDYSNKQQRKNQYEENLFRCEDDRYELDMVIETNASTIMRLEPIAATISKLSSDDKKRHALAAGALGPVHFRAIERIYGDHGVEVVEQVRLNPAVAIPVVLQRLKQKDEHWRRARQEMNKIWREVCDKNYLKSLDHRSFIFKQADKKEWSSKALLSELLDSQVRSSARSAIQAMLDENKVLSFEALASVPPRHLNGKESAASISPASVTELASLRLEQWLAQSPNAVPEKQLYSEPVTPPAAGMAVPALPPVAYAYASSVRCPTLILPISCDTVHNNIYQVLSFSLQYETVGTASDQAEALAAYRHVFSALFGCKIGGASEWTVCAENLSDDNSPETGSHSERVVGMDLSAVPLSLRTYARSLKDVADAIENLHKVGDDEMDVLPTTLDVVKSDSEHDRAPIMYGDETFYLLIRAYRGLHERLKAARKMAQDQAEREYQRRISNRDEERPDEPRLLFAPSALSDHAAHDAQVLSEHEEGLLGIESQQQSSRDPDASRRSGEQASDIADKVFQKYMELLQAFLSVSIDASVYEDRCRELLGADSYILFTMDKLVIKFVKLVQLAFGPSAHSITRSLAKLFLYESHAAAMSGERDETEYFQLALSCFKSDQRAAPTHVFRVQFLPGLGNGPNILSDGAISFHAIQIEHVSLIDTKNTLLGATNVREARGGSTDLARSSAAVLDDIVRFPVNHTNADGSYIGAREDQRTSRIGTRSARAKFDSHNRAEDFERMLLGLSMRSLTTAATQALEPKIGALYDNLVILNGLEAELCSESHRLRFKEGTEDLLYRPSDSRLSVRRDSRVAAQRAANANFQKWLDNLIRARRPTPETVAERPPASVQPSAGEGRGSLMSGTDEGVARTEPTKPMEAAPMEPKALADTSDAQFVNEKVVSNSQAEVAAIEARRDGESDGVTQSDATDVRKVERPTGTAASNVGGVSTSAGGALVDAGGAASKNVPTSDKAEKEDATPVVENDVMQVDKNEKMDESA